MSSVISYQLLADAIDRSDRRPGKKRRLKRRLRNKRVFQAVQTELVARALEDGVISIDDDMSVQIDLDGLIAFLDKLIPLIIKLIGLFG